MHPTTPRALTRTWDTTTLDRMDGAVVQVRQHTVTLTRTPAGLVATVDGEAATLERAVRLLEAADRVTVLSEVLEPTPIGNARAARLHRLLGRLGLPSAQHYALAAAALGEWAPLPSLAALSEREARTVWAHVCHTYPQARALAA
jgi:hypothetical protein